MALVPGTRLGSHEIVGLLGAGGMGEVYRAQDTKLNRQVAIKVLPDAYASDPDRVARFHREAQAVAALNHPNIAAIYDLAESGETKYLVLELIEGDTLADRLKRGPVPIDEALAIAKQILEALEAAHEKGVCHRDLKPANVKLTADGVVKVLDFGLAKFMQPAAAVAGGSLSHSPTLTVAGTLAGMIIGTAGYMSPEQAKGYEADQRSDIFSFGCILYELLTRRQAFDGDTTSEILASVLKIEADLSALPPRINPRLKETLQRCLEKNPKKRWHAAGDVRIEIESVMGRAIVVEEPRAALPSAAKTPIWRRALTVVALLAAGAAIAGYAVWRLKPEVSRSVGRFAIVLPQDQSFSNTGRQAVVISPDGTQIVYSANQRLYLRSLASLDTHPIVGTEGDRFGVINPVFSPDGQSIAFYAGADRAIKRISTTGGAPVTLCAAASPYGMSWDDRGILFAQSGKGVLRVSTSGGTPEVVAAVDSSELASSPQMLPDGQTLLYSVRKSTEPPDRSKVVAQRIGGGQRTVLIDGGFSGRYVAPGHLVYALQGVLMAVPFDARRAVVTGSAVPVVEGVRRANATATAQFSHSSNGTLIHLSGPVRPASIDGRDLGMFDRKGVAQPLRLPPDAYVSPRVSPDGKFVAVGTQDEKDEIIWIYELGGATERRRLTFGGKNRNPAWSPDSQWIAFTSDREGDSGIFLQRANGSGTAERLTIAEPKVLHSPQAWSPDGGALLLWILKDQAYTLATVTLKDKRLTPLDGIRSAVPLEAAFSPDGHWIAYQSTDQTPSTGLGSAGENISVYLEPFPRTGAKYLVPAAGGHPYWIRKTNELVLNVTSTKSTSIVVQTSPSVTFGRPADFTRVGRSEPNPATSRRGADAMPDGEHVIGGLTNNGLDETAGQTGNRIVVVLNWFDDLRRLAPLK